ncbi:MAG: sulfatase [Candidatus Wallbacteria bacterium]|nr:sulfatase [Candidatus Wallbacteria bacterium]
MTRLGPPAAFLALAAALFIGTSALPRDSRPDLLLVSIDCLRADHVGVYGCKRPTTPIVDRLANRGVRFAAAVAASDWTLASVGSFMTGMQPSRHGAVSPAEPLSLDVPTLAERLAAAGYQTGAFVCSVYNQKLGLERGFASYQGSGPIPADARLLARDAAAWWRSIGHSVRNMIPWTRRPRFMWVHFLDPHAPYLPREPYYSAFHPAPYSGPYRFDKERDPNQAVDVGKRLSVDDRDQLLALYDSEVRYTDTALGKLLESVDLSTTMLAVTADHGEEFKEHEQIGHGLNLSRQCLLVPLVFAGASVQCGHVVTAQVGLVHLAATFAAAGDAGLEPPMDAGPLQGCLQFPAQLPSRPVYSEQMESSHNLDVYSRVLGRQHALLQLERGTDTVWGVQVFDWDANWEEQDCAFEPANPVHAAARDALLTYARRMRPQLAEIRRKRVRPAALPPGQLKDLRALGYLR